MTTYTKPSTGEEVELEKWRWEAYYLDGSCTKQFDKLDEDHGEFHAFAEIDQARLRVFKMISGEGKTFTLLFKPGQMKLIHKYRHSIQKVEVLNEAGKTIDNEIRRKSYFFGYEESGHKVILVITPNDELVVTDDPDNVVVV